MRADRAEELLADWITHLGLASLPARALPTASLRLALLGGVLPDAGTPLIVAANELDLAPAAFEAVVQPLQAPLPTWILAAGIAALAPRFVPALVALSLGIVVHYALDLCQVRYGGGIYLAYPWRFDSPSLDWFWPESMANLALLAVGALALAWTCVHPGPAIRWRWRRWPALAFALAAALTPCVLTVDRFFAENVNNVDFYRAPAGYTGQPIALSKARVERVRPDGDGVVITVRKGEHRVDAFARRFERWGTTDGRPPVASDRISLRGRYDGTRVVADGTAHVHFRPIRTWTSLVGLFVIAVLAGTRWRDQRDPRVRCTT